MAANSCSLLKQKAMGLADKVNELEQAAIKAGTPKQITLDIDHLKMIDPMSGQEVYIIHMAPKGANVKPWTQAQVNALKRRGYVNIPRDIVTPALKYPHLAPEEQISLIRAGAKPSEQARMDAGLLASGIADTKVSTRGLKIDISKVEVFGDLKNKDKIANQIANVLQKYNKDSRLYGSIVEQTYTGKTIAGDIDIAANMKKAQPIAEEIGKIMENNGYKVRVKMIDAEQGLGGAGFGIEIDKNGVWTKIADIRDLEEHKKIMTYGMQTYEAATIDGISIETPREAFNRRVKVMLFPGFGLNGAEYFGPEAAFKLGRMKDIPRAKMLGDALADSMHAEAMALTGDAKIGKLNQEKRFRDALETLFEGQLSDEGLAKLTKDYDAYYKNFLKYSDDLDLYDTIRAAENRVRMPYDQRYKLPLSNLASVRAGNTAMRNVLAIANDAQIDRMPPRTVTPELQRIKAPVAEGRAYEERVPSGGRIESTRIGRTEPETRVTRPSTEERPPRTERPPREERPPRDERVPREDRIPREDRLPREDRIPREDRLPREDRIPRIDRTPRIDRIPREDKTPKTPRITLPETKGESGKKLIQSGTVAWKQGLFYKVAVIQNRKLIVLTTKEKPEGVPIVKGIKSAFKTLTRKGAYFPPEAKYDMGIMDVKITKKGKQIRFVRDVKRKTRGNYIKGEPELIVRS